MVRVKHVIAKDLLKKKKKTNDKRIAREKKKHKRIPHGENTC